ncbi:MAG: hypothetical protein RIR70_930 [Pseudomonadota bacterium]
MLAVLLATVFLLTALGCYLVLQAHARRGIQKRLTGLSTPTSRPGDAPQWADRVARAAKPLARLSLPEEGWEASLLRRRFMQAGLRHPSAPVIFYALKTLLGLCLPLGLLVLVTLIKGGIPGKQFLMMMGLLCGAGFYAPNLVLNFLIRTRREDITESLPDALDLLTICVEAGLSLDAAIARVAKEIGLKSPTLAEELELLTLEMRAGLGKEVAFKNLAARTGVEALSSLAKMLLQSERFGVAIGQSLRTHAGMLRHKRQSAAEERAAKVAVKLIFPLVLCILPAIMVVVGGPAMLRILAVLPGAGAAP